MPIYEYVCQSCQHRFEVKQSMSDPPVASCTHCGRAVTKVISASAIMFKGTGWYVTDYSEKLKPASEAKADETSSPAQKKEGEAAADTAPTAAPASPNSSSSAGPTGQPATAGTGPPSTTPATPSSSSTK